MLKLLNAIAGQEMQTTGPTEKYSRFDPGHRRERIVRSKPAKPAPRVAKKPAPQQDPGADLMAQLYCESSISTSVLRNALPNRFAGAG
ncbi:hypothetical protein [uncultured Roseobacter sp.]|uniref:hypothetical protein n=1 Tax=uncultured Roseobacter sp. TaxID=114847 RepID=UPI00262BBFBC|nr:hypothetical protein [uncultured Roseobacter sp.]